MRIIYKNENTVKSLSRKFSKCFDIKHSDSLNAIAAISGYWNFQDLKSEMVLQKADRTLEATRDICWSDADITAVLNKSPFTVIEAHKEIKEINFWNLKEFVCRHLTFPSSPSIKSVDIQRTDNNYISVAEIMEAVLNSEKGEDMWSGRSYTVFPYLVEFLSPYIRKNC